MPHPTLHVGCVSYLNSVPLIAGLEQRDPATRLHLDVPSALLTGLESGRFDIALCPVVDLFRSAADLIPIPVGGIACHGPTHTVKLFARQPLADCATVAADTDSHTSINLLRVLWPDHSPHTLELIPTDFRDTNLGRLEADAALLIGDKVITAPPPADLYPHTLDLGDAWLRKTGLPFVFAIWMARRTTDLHDLPQTLASLLDANLANIEPLATRAARDKGWPPDLALRYMTEILHYRITAEDLTAIERFRDELSAIDRVAV
ncbi:MAG: menaquinone biosynthesis protein [Phycisphaeraceae bacterium]